MAITVPIYYRPHPKLMPTRSSSMCRFALAPGTGTEFATLGVDPAAGRRCPALLGVDEDDSIGWASIGWTWTVLENCDLRRVDGGRRAFDELGAGPRRPSRNTTQAESGPDELLCSSISIDYLVYFRKSGLHATFVVVGDGYGGVPRSLLIRRRGSCCWIAATLTFCVGSTCSCLARTTSKFSTQPIRAKRKHPRLHATFPPETASRYLVKTQALCWSRDSCVAASR